MEMTPVSLVWVAGKGSRPGKNDHQSLISAEGPEGQSVDRLKGFPGLVQTRLLHRRSWLETEEHWC